MKSGNKKYVLIAAGFILFFGVFLTSKAWMPDDRALRADSYDEIVLINNWQLKVTNAAYDPKTETMTFDLFRRAPDAKLNEPEMELYNGRKSTAKEPLEFELTPRKLESSDPGAAVFDAFTVTVPGVPESYWYVSVNFECEENRAPAEPGKDVWGQTVSVASIEPEILTAAVQIDFRKTGKGS
jgi:hypothetical protein